MFAPKGLTCKVMDEPADAVLAPGGHTVQPSAQRAQGPCGADGQAQGQDPGPAAGAA